MTFIDRYAVRHTATIQQIKERDEPVMVMEWADKRGGAGRTRIVVDARDEGFRRFTDGTYWVRLRLPPLRYRVPADAEDEVIYPRDVTHAIPQSLVKRSTKRTDKGIVRWLGIRWYGRPKPLDWWDRLRGRKPPPRCSRSCGCIVKLKASAVACRQWWSAVRQA